MPLTATNVSALSRLFSSSVFRQLAEKGYSPLFARLLRDSELLDQQVHADTVGSAFDAAFSVLRKSGQRDEYVYRAALTHNFVFGRHSLNTASLLTEFRAGSCKADVVILNGTASAYEIKSERDSLSRLENQLENYRKVFAKVYVVVADSFVAQVLDNTPEHVGVMSLVRWDRIQTIRDATDRPECVCPETIFSSLRLAEASEILTAFDVEIPDLPNTKLHAALRERFAGLEPAAVHYEMVRTLKRTRNLAPLKSLISELPDSLHPAALSIQLRRADHQRLVKAVQTPISEARDWA